MAKKEVFTIRKGKKLVQENGTLIPDITPVQVIVTGPEGSEPTKMSKEDVWGEWNDNYTIKLKEGMIVARSGQICPIFGDEIPYKSVTVVCKKEQYDDVVYWLEYVHGGDCVSQVKELEDGKVAIRSDYMCW